MATKYPQEMKHEGRLFKIEHYVGLIKTQVDEWTVESWYDRGSEWGWITTIRNADGDQIGTADFAWQKKTAMLNHQYAVEKAVGILRYERSL